MSVDEYVAQVLDRAPEATPEQLARVAAILPAPAPARRAQAVMAA